MHNNHTLLLHYFRVGFFLSLSTVVVFGVLFATATHAAQKRVFMAPDDHTDYFWSATGDEYRQHFQTMLDFYIDQAGSSQAVESPEHQSRFAADGSLWLYEYEKNKTPGDFQRLVDTIKSGHISAPMNPLVITYGGVPVEAVVRSMYYSGQLERRYGVDFPLAIEMENAGMSYGLGSVWAGSGAEYSWKGVCNCSSSVPDLNHREHEIYNWLGPDGSNILMKWNSVHNGYDNQSIGGYAEARYPGPALDLVTTNAASNGFAAKYPYNTIGVFGQGWDDILTTNLAIQNTCKTGTNSTRLCVVSNMTDFFEEFNALYGTTIPTVSASFGNEWDLAPASLAEVSARVKRSLEKLRSAEALATLVSLKNPSFLNGRDVERDKAFLNLGLYFEHDFENGGPYVSGSVRITWQRQVATQIETYVNTLMADAKTALSGMIQKTGSQQRFFVFNPLSWTRSDIADIPYAGPVPVDVIDLSTGTEVPSQAVTLGGAQHLRIAAPNIPSVGYKVFEIRPDSGQAFTNAPTADAATGVMENEFYRITVSPRGAITSFIDKQLGREFASSIGGFSLNDLGASSGTLRVENAGPVSVTLVATAGSPLAHTTRVTLTRGSRQLAIQNEVTQNFSGTRTWKFSFNLTSPDVRHEEVGAIARARLTTAGGSYSPRNARYDYLTLNHFADMTGAGPFGVTLSNMDAYFMQVGSSSVTSLDTTTPQLSVVLGASLRPYNPILGQAGDSYFMQRFALQSHGAYDQAAAMRFSLEHQNPLTVGAVSGGTQYPAISYSYLSISNPNVLLWSLKPAEEGIGEGVMARVWNLSANPIPFSLSLAEPIARAKQVWHVETDRANASISGGALSASIAQNQLLSYRLFPASLPVSVKIVASDARAVENGGDTGSFTITRTGNTTQALSVPYTVSGGATAGSDYQTLSGVATIPAGSATTTITVVPLSDTSAEPQETVTLTLTPQPAYLVSLWGSSTLSLVSNNNNPAPTSTVVRYSFSEGSGGTTADVSGNNNTGTLQNGASWTSGKYGNGINFDGVNDHVSVPDAPTLDLGIKGTIEAWVKLDTVNRWHGVISKGILNSDPAHNYALEIDNTNRFFCLLGNGGTSIEAKSTATAVIGQYYHLACAWDGATLRLYLNGVLSAAIAQSITPLSNSLPLYIGQFGSNADKLDGIIDEVRIYNKALTVAEIQTDMNTPIDSTPPPSDVEKPSIPTGLTITSVSPTQINLSWNASTDNIGVTGYRISRNNTPIATTTTTSYSNTNLTPSTSYTYTVAALDAAQNISAESAPVSTTTPAVPPSAGRVALYAFQEGSGTVAGDLSGNGNTGTLTNGPVWTTAGKYGNTINFDGTNDHLVVPDKSVLDIGSAGTIEAWVKLDTLNRWHGVVAKGNANSDPIHNYALEINNSNRFLCMIGNGTSAVKVSSTTTPATNTFYHVACVWNGTSLKLYINGALNASGTQNITPAANTAPLYIGQFGGNTDRLDGIIDEVRVYNRALEQSEIQSDMNTPL